MSEPIAKISGTTVVMPQANIDTDQIIPARFLKGTSRSGLGVHLFADLRYDSNKKPRSDFPLNLREARQGIILVAGNNFGCGSSREHAPWALWDYGFRAVISTEIADIFRNNALKNGLVPVVIDAPSHAELVQHPGQQVTVDVAEQIVHLPRGGQTSFEIEPFARYRLLQGIDELDFLLENAAAIAAFEAR